VGCVHAHIYWSSHMATCALFLIHFKNLGLNFVVATLPNIFEVTKLKYFSSIRVQCCASPIHHARGRGSSMDPNRTLLVDVLIYIIVPVFFSKHGSNKQWHFRKIDHKKWYSQINAMAAGKLRVRWHFI
jgi:hypothetical protein